MFCNGSAPGLRLDELSAFGLQQSNLRPSMPIKRYKKYAHCANVHQSYDFWRSVVSTQFMESPFDRLRPNGLQARFLDQLGSYHLV